MEALDSKLTHRDYEVLADFRYALRRYFSFSEAAALDVGLTPQQYQALLAIRGFPVDDLMTIGELAERMQMRPHSAVALVNRLTRKKLVVRIPSQRDKRQVHLDLTKEGRAVLEQLARVHHEELRQIRKPIDKLIEYLKEEDRSGW